MEWDAVYCNLLYRTVTWIYGALRRPFEAISSWNCAVYCRSFVELSKKQHLKVAVNKPDPNGNEVRLQLLEQCSLPRIEIEQQRFCQDGYIKHDSEIVLVAQVLRKYFDNKQGKKVSCDRLQNSDFHCRVECLRNANMNPSVADVKLKVQLNLRCAGKDTKFSCRFWAIFIPNNRPFTHVFLSSRLFFLVPSVTYICVCICIDNYRCLRGGENNKVMKIWITP